MRLKIKSRYSDVLSYTEELRGSRSRSRYLKKSLRIVSSFCSASINVSTLPHVHNDSLKVAYQQPSLNISSLAFPDATHQITNASPPLMVSCEPHWEQSFQPALSSSFNEHLIGPSAAPWEAIDMDWSGLDTGFLEDDQQTAENLV